MTNAIIQGLVRQLLGQIDPAPEREGLLETPARVAKAWGDWTSGYHQNASDILKQFNDGGEGYDENVTVKDIPFYSHCEHHLAPFFGTACIAYIPNGRVVGLSKLSRLVNMHSRRLQVQERLTVGIANDLVEHLAPHGVAVMLRGRHMCMESRGVRTVGSETVTLALRGAVKDDPALRAEILSIFN